MSKSPSKQEISREEIRAIYAQGESAVVALVEGLLQRISKLEARIEALENQKSKDSHNSSKPPSSDGFGKRTKSLRQKSKRSSGGQKGHRGHTLDWSEDVDEIVPHLVIECEGCGESLAEAEAVDLDLRQVYDLPRLKLKVIEHQTQVKCCPHCGLLNQGEFPSDVNSVVQYGAGIKGLIVYLMEGQLLPSGRTCELLEDVFGCEVSEGSLYNARERCFEQLAPVAAQVKAAIEAAGVGHFDETGMRVNGKLMWLHVACTDGLTYYFIHAKRGKEAIDEMDILPNFTGTSVHDGLKSYKSYDCQHGLCNAHHLRELLFISERYGQPWADEMMTLLTQIKDQVEVAHESGQSTLGQQQIEIFEQRYQALISQGLQANPPPPVDKDAPKRRGRKKQSPPKNLLDRLDVLRSHVLAFMYDFRVPFDNNQAERDLRMMKLKQKISGGFRSLKGGQMHCRIRGYISTLKKQKINVLEALRNVFREAPVFPSLKPE